MGQFVTITSGWMDVLFYIISDRLYFETIIMAPQLPSVRLSGLDHMSENK